MTAKPTENQFWSLVDKTGSCWLWLGRRDGNGYGKVGTSLAGTPFAHRAAYILTRGPIPKGKSLDHICHSAATAECRGGDRCPHRGCVNPAHLEPVTHYVNMRRGVQATQTHCKHGHELAGYNLILQPRKNGKHEYRQCRECLLRRDREFRARKEFAHR